MTRPDVTISNVSNQRETAARMFADRFGRSPRLFAAAPGRINLIGEHTDYNRGLVLPMAINRHVIIAADRANNSHSTLCLPDVEEEIEIDTAQPLSPQPRCAANYVLGVIELMRRRGIPLPCIDMLVTSTIPMGAGLASSAALEVAAATLIEEVSGHRLDLLSKARLCQAAEHEFAGTPCGIMDMLIAAGAQPGHAMFIDCDTLEIRHVKMFAREAVSLVVINTGIRRELAGSEYSQRRKTCEHVAAKLGVASLRHALITDLKRADLTEEESRRARHVITENQRVKAAVAALKNNDPDAFGRLMFESHESLRNDYEVSCPELDAVVESARTMTSKGVYGARMTGAGFGGCAIVFCRHGFEDSIKNQFAADFVQNFGRKPEMFIA